MAGIQLPCPCYNCHISYLCIPQCPGNAASPSSTGNPKHPHLTPNAGVNNSIYKPPLKLIAGLGWDEGIAAAVWLKPLQVDLVMPNRQQKGRDGELPLSLFSTWLFFHPMHCLREQQVLSRVKCCHSLSPNLAPWSNFFVVFWDVSCFYLACSSDCGCQRLVPAGKLLSREGIMGWCWKVSLETFTLPWHRGALCVHQGHGMAKSCSQSSSLFCT